MSEENGPAGETNEHAGCNPGDQDVESYAYLARQVATIVAAVSQPEQTIGTTYLIATALSRACGDVMGGSVSLPGHEACSEALINRIRVELVRQIRAEKDATQFGIAASGATQPAGRA